MNVLYAVTAVVVLGLVVWVAAALWSAREPWARPQAPPRSDDAGPPSESDGRDVNEPEAPIDADSTARATPIALAGRAKSDDVKP